MVSTTGISSVYDRVFRILMKRSVLSKVVTNYHDQRQPGMSKANLLTKSVRVIAAIKPQKQATRRSNPTSSCFGAPKPEPRHNLKLDWGPVQHLAYYSCDESRNISFDFACLRAFRQPLIPTDLTRGQALFLRKNRRNRWVAHPTPLEHLTRACVALGKEAELYGADAVTRRGLLVR